MDYQAIVITFPTGISAFSSVICSQADSLYVKSVRIRSYSGPYFPTFGINAERYRISLRIYSECGKMQTRITPNTDTFHAVPWVSLIVGGWVDVIGGYRSVCNYSMTNIVTVFASDILHHMFSILWKLKHLYHTFI